MPVLTYQAQAPVVLTYDPSDLKYTNSATILKPVISGQSPLKVGIGGGGASRPASGQVYPRGDQ